MKGVQKAETDGRWESGKLVLGVMWLLDKTNELGGLTSLNVKQS